MEKKRVGGLWAAFLAGASFGLGGAISQIVSAQGFEIKHITTAQYLCAALILGLLVAFKFRAHMTRKEVAQLVGVGALSVVSSLCYYYAIDFLTVGQAVAIQFQYVWIAVVIQNVVERTRPTAWVVGSTVLIILGTLLGSGFVDEVISGGGSISLNPAGVTLALVCAFCYACFIYLNGRVATEHPPVTRTFVMSVSGVIVMAFIAPDFYTDTISGSLNIAALAPGGITMGLVMSVIPCVCLVAAARYVPGGIVAILSSSELPVAVIAGCLLLGEQATVLSVAGVLIICVSIVLSQMGELRASSPSARESEK